ncbi:MAG: dienelactone hydrolase family protein, partial [Candidatus Hydrogenedentota bacterium]
HPELFPCIVLFPQAPLRYVWTSESSWPRLAGNDATPIVDAELDEVLRDYTIDEDRIYLTGVSMGAHGTYYYGARRPDLFAALMPISGHPRYQDASILAALPIWIFHNAGDTRIDSEESQHMAGLIAQDGGDVQITLYDSAAHNSWDRTYNDPEVIEWLLSQSR